ncbi:MAG TPA: hypothetical protein VMV69_10765 [Pirellulales bacterium]|nr:hypothetical protein [Pirellulales bacterium]
MDERSHKPNPGPVGKPALDAPADSAPDRGDADPEHLVAGGASESEHDESPGLPGRGVGAERFKGIIYRYIPVECPSCGFEGRVKIASLDRTFHCKQCKRVFHVDVRGTIAGERPPEEIVAVDPSAPIAPEKPNWVERRFLRLPRVARWGVLVAMVLALAGVGLLFKQVQEAPLPLDLHKRAELAGKALAQGDWRLLDRMAMPGHSDALHEWYTKARPKEFAALTLESDVNVVVGQLAEMFRRAERVPGKKKKVPIADFRTPVEIVLPGNPQGPARFQVDFVWVKAKDGEWQIDGEWARDTEAAKSAAGIPPQRRRRSN